MERICPHATTECLAQAIVHAEANDLDVPTATFIADSVIRTVGTDDVGVTSLIECPYVVCETSFEWRQEFLPEGAERHRFTDA